MKQLKAYKFRIYPSDEQKIFFSKTFGCVRLVYNLMLNDRIKAYEESKGNPDKKIKYPTPAKYKKEHEFLKEVDSLALANAQMNLDKAYKNFFRNKSVGFPKFKSKKNPVQSYTTNNQNGTINIFESWLKLPKLKELIKIKAHRKIEDTIKSATISRNGSGKYFISLLCEVDIQELPKTNSSVGIDLGIKDIAILSTGEKIENLKFRKQLEDKLKREQRKLSKRLLIAKKENRKLSEAKNYQNNKLEYKAKWYGKEIIKIDRLYPSSQICSVCGYRDGKKALNIREWTCPICNTYHDRDINASKNILVEGLRIREAI